MISAEDARIRTMATLQKNITDEFERIEEDIQEAILTGSF